MAAARRVWNSKRARWEKRQPKPRVNYVKVGLSPEEWGMLEALVARAASLVEGFTSDDVFRLALRELAIQDQRLEGFVFDEEITFSDKQRRVRLCRGRRFGRRFVKEAVR